MATGGTGTAARTIATLSSVFSYAMDEEWIDKNPCRGVKVRPDQKCERFLSEAEAGRLGEVLKEWDTDGAAKTAVPIIRLLSLTGARRSEITNLKWLDFDQGFLRLGDSKTGHSIRPLSSMALNVLKALPREHPKWVFPSATGDTPFQGIGKLWRKIRKDADLEDVRLHDLRHSFASFGAANGLSLPMIGALLGHRNYSTTQRYAHLTNHAAREAADGIAEVVGGAFKL
jgi:integrase